MLLGSFLPQSDFSQLLKVSKLMEHYDFHLEQAAAEGQDFSFGEYLWIHFVQPDNHEHEDDSHQDLPLQTFSGSTSIEIVATDFTLNLPPPNQEETRFSTQSWVSQSSLRTILRPPIG